MFDSFTMEQLMSAYNFMYALRIKANKHLKENLIKPNLEYAGRPLDIISERKQVDAVLTITGMLFKEIHYRQTKNPLIGELEECIKILKNSDESRAEDIITTLKDVIKALPPKKGNQS